MFEIFRDNIDDEHFSSKPTDLASPVNDDSAIRSKKTLKANKIPCQQTKTVSFAGGGGESGGGGSFLNGMGDTFSKHHPRKTPKKLSRRDSLSLTATTTTPTRTPLRTIRNHDTPGPTTPASRRLSTGSSASRQQQQRHTTSAAADAWYTPTSSTDVFTPSLADDNNNNLRKSDDHDSATMNRQQHQMTTPVTALTPSSASSFRRSLRSTFLITQQNHSSSDASSMTSMSLDGEKKQSSSIVGLNTKSASELSSTLAGLRSLQTQKQQLQRRTETSTNIDPKETLKRDNSMQSSNLSISKIHKSNTNAAANQNRSRLGGYHGVIPKNGTLGLPSCQIPQPNTPNTLLRTEMEHQNVSLLLTPPPGATWSAFPDSADGSCSTTPYNEEQTGLVVISPQAAVQLQKKLVLNTSYKPSDESSRTAKSHSHQFGLADIPSAALPRTILQTSPKPVSHYVTTTLTENGQSDTVNASSPNDDKPSEIVKPNLSMAKLSHEEDNQTKKLTSMVDHERSWHNDTADDSFSALLECNLKPLSFSMPAHVLSRLKGKIKEGMYQPRNESGSSVGKSGLLQTNGSSMFTNIAKITHMKTLDSIAADPAKAKFDVRRREKSPREPVPMSVDHIDEDSPPGLICIAESVSDTSVTPTSTTRGGVAFEISPTDKAKHANKPPIRHIVKKTAVLSTHTSLKSGVTDDWGDHQSKSFVAWLNYTFHPEEVEQQRESDLQTSENTHFSICTNISGLRSLVLHRRLAQGRSRAKDLFKSEKMRLIREAIVLDIARGRLSMRPDRDITADLQLRQELTSLLLSYTTPWLRLGLEVMFSEYIEPVPFNTESPKTYLTRMKQALEVFIQKRLLSDDATLGKFTKGRCTLPSGKFEKRYKDQMRCLVLSRIMVLIFFLDHAKMENTLDKVPRLFTLSSEVKSSRDVIVAVCRACLHAEGDVIKHLSRIGLKASYEQLPVDEVNFHVTNLAHELRDGVLLTRLAEIVSGAPVKSLMSLLRLPAVSRLQKKYNVNLAMAKLQQYGISIPDGINAHHVMDGHREIVLALLWCIISHFCMNRLLKGESVEYEIEKVIRSTQARQKMQDKTILFRVAQPKSAFSESTPGLNEAEEPPESTLRQLLLRWGQAVCAAFGTKVIDFSGSFADGKAICLLIHYYHPSLIRLDDILLADDVIDESLSTIKEQKRWLRASKALHELGGIPNMLPRCDSTHPPDEKAMLLSLSYLFSRLTESSNEILAAILIQACYRKYKHRILLQKKIVAAGFILQFWKLNRENYFRYQQRRYAAAVAKLEEFVMKRKHSLKRLKAERLERERRHRSAILIQKIFRGGIGRSHANEVFRLYYATLTLQTFFRCCLARSYVSNLQNEHKAATTIQRVYRGFLDYGEYQLVKHATVDLQRAARSFLVRQERQKQIHAALVIQQKWWKYVEYSTLKWGATKIQCTWRGWVARKSFQRALIARDAASIIEKTWRGFRQRMVFSIAKESMILIQKAARGYNTRKKLSLRRYQRAAALIQKVWRGFSMQVSFQLAMMDIVCVQNLVRRHLACELVKRRICAIATLQGAMRCSIARRAYLQKVNARRLATRQKNAAIMCQCAVRCWMARSELAVLRSQFNAATMLQKKWRGHKQYRRHILHIRAACFIQSGLRRMLVRVDIVRKKRSAYVIQKSWERYKQRQLENDAATILQTVWRSRNGKINFLEKRRASCLIQKAWRGYITRMDLSGMRFAAVQIQSCWRCFWAQQNFHLDILEIIFAQSAARRFLARKKFLQLKATTQASHAAATVIQSIMRGHRSRLLYHSNLMHIISCQSLARRWLARTRLNKMIDASIVIQNALRRQCAEKQALILREKLLVECREKKSAISIQALVRGYMSRIFYLQATAARRIQKTWRGYRNHVDYLVVVYSTVQLQAHFRSCIAQKDRVKRRAAIIKLQAAFRLFLARKRMKDERVAATKIQTAYRRFFVVTEFEIVISAALIIQGYIRGTLCRNDLKKKIIAATDIQRIWRGYVLSTAYLVDLSDIIKAQSFVRMWLARRRYKILTFQRIHYTKLIQRSYRQYVMRQRMETAACMIQRQFREFTEKKRIILVSNGVKQFQSIVRGVLTRKRRTKRLIELAQRVSKETKRALLYPQLRLGARTHQALEIIRHSESLTKIMDAVKELEASTRLSVVCCEVFTRAGAADDLLRLIQSCNRSVPHMELKEHILLTLENIGLHDELVRSLATSKYCEVFMDNIQVFRDKDGIFCLAISLLDRITSTDVALAQFCGTHERLKQLREVYRVVSRKKIDMRESQRLQGKKKKIQYGIKKRVVYDRDMSTKVLGDMILSFADNTQLNTTIPHQQQQKQHFTFD